MDEDTILTENGVLRDQQNKHYFQFRIDELAEGTQHPKIYVGLCRADFDLNRNLSRQANVWCIFLKSGDKFTGKRWRNYYEINEDP